MQHLCNGEHQNFIDAWGAISAMVEEETKGTRIRQTPRFDVGRSDLFGKFSLAKPSKGAPGKPTSACPAAAAHVVNAACDVGEHVLSL